MVTVVPLLVALAVPGAPPETRFVQVAPKARPAGEWRRGAGARRAVVLIQGLAVQPFSAERVERAALRDWQRPGSHLVRALEADSDVYAFAYAQNVGVDEIADLPDLRDGVRRLRGLGYPEVVLVGFSAGGLVARRLVEDHPGAGVTKVVQVCSPNGGSGWARLQAVRRNQRPFLQSLTKEERNQVLRSRLDVRLPDAVEFVCLVGTRAVTGDGVVSRRSQWTEDLQEQGVPAVAVPVDHLSAVRSASTVETIAELVRTPQPRWTPAQVLSARKAVLRD
jgi:pimeloyl-ACP methyl ester carboxylesterase